MGTLNISDSIAVIGMSCRFPGAENIEEFWENLKNGVESITHFSDEELMASGVEPSVMNDPNYVRAGFVMKDEARFDAQFFGYSPKEAQIMDPQHRQFLETAWEALEDGGYPPDQNRGTIGVFAGSKMSTYLMNYLNPGPLTGSVSDFQYLIGNDKDYLTTRVSYKLNLKGPSVSVQTACSTSLVAVHLACENLLSAACDMALAGGAAIVVPQKKGYPYQDGMVLSPDGHCRAFDSKAQGMAPGNGIGVVLLKRLEDAIADRDRIHAVVRGSAVNNDGSHKVGYTTPSVKGQANVIREALAISGVEAASVSYIEAHGTGTDLGDPVEIAALTDVFRAGTEKKAFCAVGSVKTNIGHLDTAAGVSSFIKTVLCLKNGQIPPSLNFEQPNPNINFSDSPFYVNADLVEWKRNGYPRRAGVSSFGFGGTNAHLILEEAPTKARAPMEPSSDLHITTLSAKSKKALDRLVVRYETYLNKNKDIPLRNIAFTANAGRSHFSHRVAMVSKSTEQLSRQLSNYVGEGVSEDLIKGCLTEDIEPRIAFLFSGQGGQYTGMGRRLYDTQPRFRNALNRCDAILRENLNHSILSVIFGEGVNASLLDETCYTQPGLFALGYALSEMWRSWGIEPTAVMGHSVGEYVAACVAGVFGLEDGLKLIAARGRLIQGLQRKGQMFAVFQGEAFVRKAVAPYGDVAIAAINGPKHVVISGSRKSLKQITQFLEARNVFYRRLNVSHAFHSPIMDPMLSEFEKVAAEIVYRTPKIDWISNVTGRRVKNADECASDYWRRHVREPVQFFSGIKKLHENGCRLLIELGPGAALMNMGRKCLPNETGQWTASLKKGRDDLHQVLMVLSACYVNGIQIDWSGFYKECQYHRISLPTYPFERQRFWMESPKTKVENKISSLRYLATDGEEYPFDGRRLNSAATIFEFRMTSDALPSLKDHRVYGMTVMPAGAYWEMLFAAGGNVFGGRGILLENMTMHAPMMLDEGDAPLRIQIIFDTTSDDDAAFEVYSAVGHSKTPTANWTLHMSGAIRRTPENGAEMQAGRTLEQIRTHCHKAIVMSEFMKGLEKYGAVGGRESPWWRFKEIRANGREVLGKIGFTDRLLAEADAYQLHPSIIDPCIQTLTAAFMNSDTREENGTLFLPIGFDTVRYGGPVHGEIWCNAIIRPGETRADRSFTADFRLFDDGGGIIAEIIGVHMRPAHGDTLLADAGNEISYEINWQLEETLPPGATHEMTTLEAGKGCWIILADRAGVSDTISRLIRESGDTCVMIFAEEKPCPPDGDDGSIKPLTTEDYARIFNEQLIEKNLPCKGVMHLWSLDHESPEQLTARALKKRTLLDYAGVVNVIQAIAEVGMDVPVMGLVTRGVQVVGPADTVISVSSSALWGIRKVVTKEHPEMNCMAVDLSASGNPDEIRMLMGELKTHAPDREVAFRSNKKYVPRLVRSPWPETSLFRGTSYFHPEATYLLTGGLGGVGIELIKWLAAHGARHFALINRHQPKNSVVENIKAVEKSGARVSVFQADVADQQRLSVVIKAVRETMPPLRGVFHLAGVSEKREIRQQRLEDMQSILAAKVDGAWNMHLLTQQDALDHFVLFSSLSALWGWHGLSGYAAANRFLDTLAHYRRVKKLPALSVNWGAFSQVGMLAKDHEGTLRREKSGLGSFSPKEALPYLGMAFSKNRAQVCIAKIDWSKFIEQPGVQDDPFLSCITATCGNKKKEAAAGEKLNLVKQLGGLSMDQRRGRIETYLKQQISTFLNMPLEDVSADGDLIQMGMDSLMFLGLAQKINKAFHINIVPHKIFENPNILSLAEQFAKDIESDERRPDSTIEVTQNTILSPDPENRFKPFELTDIQQAYWVGRNGILGMGKVACHAYHEFDTVDLDLVRYTLAWRRLIKRHEMLRMIVLPNGRQQILEHVPPYKIELLDVADERSETIESELKAVRRTMSHQVLKTDQWPLFEVRATRMDRRRIRLHLSLDLLIADVHSIKCIMRELCEFYRNPDTIDMAPLEISFRDYIEAEARFRNSDAYRQSRQYWIERMSTLAKAPELPIIKNMKDLKKPKFVRKAARLEPDLWGRLKARAGEAGLTPSGVLLAAYAEILARWSKSSRFTINLPIFNRLPVHPQINEIVGDFTSVLFQEVDCSNGGSFESRAVNMQKQFWRDMEHRFFSGVQILRELTQNKEGGGPDIMPVVFTSNLVSGENNPENADIQILGKIVYGISQTPQVWMDLQVSEESGALAVYWDVVEALFPPGMLDDMFSAYCGFIRRLAEQREAWQEDAPVAIPENQLAKRLDVNATQSTLSSLMLHDLFAVQVDRNPGKNAVVTSGGSLTYDALSKRSDSVAHLLREKGARPNTLVAVVMEKGWEQVVAVLGILKSGAAYLPIDPSVPGKRLQHLLAHGNVHLVLTQSGLQSKLEWPGNAMCFSVDRMEPLSETPAPSASIRQPGDLAYVIYTSGSTGLPKGVMVDHRGAVNTILDMNERFNVGPQDSIMALSSLSFDLSVYDIFGALAAGATIVMPDADRTKDPGHWMEWIQRGQVTIWNSVPSLIKMLVEYAQGKDNTPRRDPRLVLLSGDWIPLDLPDGIRSVWKNVQLISLGGATEASIWSIIYPIGAMDARWKSIPYGRPMRNQRFYVLNEKMENCPDWVPGQLYIGGVGVAKGYWRDEEKTRNSFVIHPRTQEKLYRTGDLGRYLPDGDIEFLGREDSQVKIGGYRIELGEIEAVLKQHPGVREAVVIDVEKHNTEKFLAGYVVPKKNQNFTTDAVRSFLNTMLPEYMIPGTLMKLDAIPLSSNDKLDRKALPLPSQSPLMVEDSYVAPQNELEEKIARVVEEMLDLEKAGTHDRFFNLGANSLDIVRIQNKLTELLLQDISVIDLFEHSTIHDLAAYLNREKEEKKSSPKARRKANARKRAALNRKIKNN